MPYQALEKKARKKGKESRGGPAVKALRTFCPKTPRLSPLMTKMKRRKREILPLRGERRRGRLPWT